MKNMILFSMLFVLAVACSKKKDDPQPLMRQSSLIVQQPSIEGKWWLSGTDSTETTYYWNAGVIDTSMKFSTQTSYNADSVTYYVNWAFRLDNGRIQLYRTPAYPSPYSNNDSIGNYTIHGDTVLINLCFNNNYCQIYEYGAHSIYTSATLTSFTFRTSGGLLYIKTLGDPAEHLFTYLFNPVRL